MKAGYGNDNLRDWKGAGGTQTYYVYDGVVPVLELSSSGVVTAVTTAIGNTPLTRHTSAGSVFYAYDPMGGVAHRLDSSSNVLTSHAFDALGAASSTGTTSDPYADFKAAAGYRVDPESGFLLAGQRYYDTNGGRFLTRDPIGQLGGANMYRCCGNNELAASDPMGLCPSEPSWWEQMIPVWGNARMCIYCAQKGDLWGMLGYAGMAGLDCFGAGEAIDGVKGLMLAKRTSEAAFEVGSKAIEATVEAAAPPGRVVIGESMDRVMDAAKSLDAEFYSGMPGFEPGVTPPDVSWADNEAWLRDKVEKGYDILDIGLDENRAIRGVSYANETELMNGLNYPGHTHLSWPGSITSSMGH